jgi:hypothetical protein
MPRRDVKISQTRLTGGEILLARGHWGGKKYWCGVLPSVVLFRLMVPSF